MPWTVRKRGNSTALGVGLLAVALSAPSTTSNHPAAAAVAKKVQHVVVLYQENHTHDETLGVVCQRRANPCDGFTGTVTLKGGVRVAMRKSPDIVPVVDHSVSAQDRAVDGGLMDGWATLRGCGALHAYSCLSYYTPDQIPNLAALANRYAVASRMFSMSDSPSWGGHLYPATSTLDGFTGDNPPVAATTGPGWGCDSGKVSPWRNPRTGQVTDQPTCIPDYSLNPNTHPFGGAFRQTPVKEVRTILTNLTAAKLAWKIYGQPTPGPAKSPKGESSAPYVWSICPSIASCLYTHQVNNLVPAADILSDAAHGTLPTYSIITPGDSATKAAGGGTSQHNHNSMLIGDNWIGRVVSAIQQGPDAATTTIFITYDDCGCFYDHVRPGVNPDGTKQGPRLPMVIISPYAKPGYTDPKPATFNSVLAYTEHAFGLPALTVNDAAAYDFSNAFNYNQTPLTPVPLAQRLPPPASRSFLSTHRNGDAAEES